ncbi:pre-rRNA processing protein [Elasticomyces elasticus]|nr:pre-rRNA processing protein [Elasticomyces elasticus]
MSSFFTAPASQRKRKRPQTDDRPAAKRNAAPVQKRAEARDESISGSDSDDDARGADAVDPDDSSSDSEAEDVASKRIRLAEQYLANTQREVLVEEGFDAVDVDQENLRRRMGERLKEDSAEGKGKLYRWIAAKMDWGRAERRVEGMGSGSVTGVAVQGKYAYAVSKDGALSKWELPTRETPMQDGKQVGRARSRAKRVAYTRGARGKKNERDYLHHVGAILCVAASQDGKFVATGGLDKRIVIWDAATLKPLKVFTQHRDSVSSLAFRRGTNQLFSASRDRTVKIWSLDELAYVETLFGHQDEVVDVDALGAEKCVTVGARDRTARQWKVVEESQLVFRGGGAGSKTKTKDKDNRFAQNSASSEQQQKAYNEGSMDRVACIDDETFITGSDNGSLSLWNVHKKKAVFTYPLAHGLDPPLPLEAVSAEAHPKESALGEPQPRWITALRAIPFSDTFITGSWDGVVRTWRISEDKRRIEPVGAIGVDSVDDSVDVVHHVDGLSSERPSISEDSVANLQPSEDRKLIIGVINDLAIIDRGERAKDGVLVAAAVGKQHRLGRWSEMSEAKNCLILFEVPRRGASLANGVAQSKPAAKADSVEPEVLGSKAEASVLANSVANSEMEFEERSPASQQVSKEMREAAETGQSQKDRTVDGASPSKSTVHASDIPNGDADEEDEFAGFDD